MIINLNEIRKAINLIEKNIDLVEWEDMTNKGNPCYDPFDLTEDERAKEILIKAAVELIISRNSDTHAFFSSKIAAILGNKWITYPWLIQALSRLLSGIDSYQELSDMINIVRTVKEAMKKRGLTQINTIEEAFA